MNNLSKGHYFLLPNKIFDEELTPYEFTVYSFLVRAKDNAGYSYWSVPKIALKCKMCETTCRNVLHSLEDKGYINITKRFIDNVQQSHLYQVNKI